MWVCPGEPWKRLSRDVAAGDGQFVVLLGEHTAYEANDGALVPKDAGHVRRPLDAL